MLLEKIGLVLTYSCSMHKLCEYCYSKSMKNIYSEMPIDYFRKLLLWVQVLDGPQCNELQLLGGEPTEYSYFDIAMDLINREINSPDLKVSVYTHGCFKEDKLEALLENKRIKHISFHYDDRYFFGKNLMDNFIGNMEKLVKAGQKVLIRYNTSDLSFPYEGVLNLAAKFQIELVYSLTAPCPGNCSYIEIEQYDNFIPKLVKFVKDSKKMGVKIKLSRPIPYCALSNLENKEQFINLGGLRFACNPFPTINPDGSLLSCTTLFKWKTEPATTFEEFKLAIYEALEKGETIKYKENIPDKCKSCKYFIDRVCQGGCLSYRELIDSDK